MKNVFICVIAIIIATMTMFMGGCTFFDDLFAPSDNEDADNKLQSFVDCLRNEDREGISAKDTGDKGNVGIESFYIIKATDDPNYPQYTYRGDGLWTPGINIGKVHEKFET